MPSRSLFNFQIPANDPDAKTNIFLLGKQGIGKTNIISLFMFFMFMLYEKTKAKHGCIPIIFSPLFEYTKLKHKTVLKSGLFPPNANAQGMDAIHYSFKMANVPPYLEDQIKIVRLDFKELTTEDIGTFGNIMGNEDALGRVDKILEAIEADYGPNYSVDEFLEAVQEDKAVYNALYYIFKRLKQNGLFDESISVFDWEDALRQKKPICFHFGEIEDESSLQALTGILLRKLFKLSNKYINAVYKKVNIESQKDSELLLTEDEKWFLDNFVIGLFFEEAHRFFPPTTTKVLRSFPASKYFKLISMALGRKRNFKFNFLVSQRLELIFKEFRTEFDYLFTGSKVDATDKKFLYGMFRQVVPTAADSNYLVAQVCANQRFEFTAIDVNKLSVFVSKSQAKEPIGDNDFPLTKFKAFVSPCGQY